jgi:hypothetical protein
MMMMDESKQPCMQRVTARVTACMQRVTARVTACKGLLALESTING